MAEGGRGIDILRRMPRRTIGMRITEEGLVEVRAPLHAPMMVIRRFVAGHQEWIERMRKRIAALPKPAKRSYQEGSVFRIAGVPYVIHLTDGNAVVPAGTRIFFPRKFIRHPKPHMEPFVRMMAKKYLVARTAHFAKIMGVSYKRISIRDTSSRWGSCSSTGTISFAYRLVFAEPSIIDYVIIHELSHITHSHHKETFWKRVEEFYPDYKAARRWLATWGHTLRIS